MFGHRLVERTDAALEQEQGEAEDTPAVEVVAGRLESANEDMAEYLRKHATTLLNDVLYTSSNLMHNGFAMSDRWN